MLKLGQELVCKIEEITILGRGVCKADGFVIFVDGAVCGDRCKIRVTDVKKSYATAVFTEMIEKSERRVEPECPYFPFCGGCVHRCISYSDECQIKENAVRRALLKVSLSDENVKPLIATKDEGYRNKAVFHFDGGNVGFYAAGSNKLVPFSDALCGIYPPSFHKIATDSAEYFSDKKTAADSLTLRVSTDGKICAVIDSKMNDKDARAYAEYIKGRHGEISGVLSVRGKNRELSHEIGDKHIMSTLAGLKFRISPEAFFQVNYDGAEKIAEIVLNFAEKCSFTKCVDLYCGTGTLGIILASRFKNSSFTGVEINKSAVKDAKYNAELNGIQNIEFFCGDAAKYAAENKPELAVVDPPRRGMSGEAVKILTDMHPDNIIYVSCNPSTLARDAARLADHGYKISEAVPINMFPRSEHVECVMLLTCEKGRAKLYGEYFMNRSVADIMKEYGEQHDEWGTL